MKIDTEEMVKGKEVAAKLRENKGGGIPWIAILDGQGKTLITSDGPQGNVGCPVSPDERKWFMGMIQKTKNRMTDKDIALVRQSLAAFAKKLGR